MSIRHRAENKIINAQSNSFFQGDFKCVIIGAELPLLKLKEYIKKKENHQVCFKQRE